MSIHTLTPILRYAGFTSAYDNILQPNTEPWRGHIAFARVLMAEFQPELLVELGTLYGVSFFALCEAAKDEKLSTRCVAVDSWEGDPHAGFYGDEVYERVKAHAEGHYGQWATLMRCLFDDALPNFEDESIDLLHIDGLHTYAAVRHDFDTWLPKVKAGGIILFHDVNEFRDDFGAHKVWDEIAPLSDENFLFRHSHGLGVWRKPGAAPLDPAKAPLLAALLGSDKVAATMVATYTTSLAEREVYRRVSLQLQQEKDQVAQELSRLTAETSDVSKVIQQLAACENDLQNTRNTLHTVLNSHSWKLTSILRMPRALLQSLGSDKKACNAGNKPCSQGATPSTATPQAPEQKSRA